MGRTRAYRRDVRRRHIERKKWICKHVYGWMWYDCDGKYSKGKIDESYKDWKCKIIHKEREKEYIKSHLKCLKEI